MRRLSRQAALTLLLVLTVVALAVWSQRVASVSINDIVEDEMKLSDTLQEESAQESTGEGTGEGSAADSPEESAANSDHESSMDENGTDVSTADESSTPQDESEAQGSESEPETEESSGGPEPPDVDASEEEVSAPEDQEEPQEEEIIEDADNEVENLLYVEEGDWVLADSYAAVAQALDNNKIYIRLTQDIYLEGSYRLTHDMVLDGLREDGTYCTVTERYNNISYSFRLNAGGLHVTIQNMNIMGYEHHGFVSQLDTGAAGSDCVVTYENVRYQGPQLAWLRWSGRLVLRDCEIDLLKNEGGNDAGELGECMQFVFGGKTRVTKHEGTDSMFWIFNHNTGGEGLLEIEDGAYVELEHKVTYLTYREPGGNGVDRYSFVIGDDAVLHMKTKLGWCYYLTQYFNDITIGTNSIVTMHRESETVPGDYYNLLVKDSLRIGQGSSFVVESQRPIIYLGLDSVIEMDNPKEFRLEMSMKGNTPSQIIMRAKAFNQWTNNDVAGPPDRILSAPYGEEITLSWSGGSASASWIDEVTGQPVVRNDVDDLIPYMKTELKRFVAGDYELEVDEMTVYSTVITGAMEASIRLVISYFTWDADVSNEGNRLTAEAVFEPEFDREELSGFLADPQYGSDPSGYGAFARNEDILFDITKTIAHEDSMLVRNTVLYAREERTLPDPGRLALVKYPEVLRFGTHMIPFVPTIYPLTEDSAVVIQDSRINPEDAVWNLTAKSGPFRNDTVSAQLDADTVGFLRDGVYTGLKQGALIWQSSWEEDNPEHVLEWRAGDRQNGFAVRLGPDAGNVDEFRAVVTWTLSVGPA